jgi:hypothetical protein
MGVRNCLFLGFFLGDDGGIEAQWNFKILVDEDVENDNKEWQRTNGRQ